MTQSLPYLRLSQVTFAPHATPIIDNLSLTLHGTERVGLVGASGSGKSTLLKLMLGLYRPHQGTLHCQDRPIQAHFWQSLNWYRQQVQYIPQDPHHSLPPNQTVEQALMEPKKRLTRSLASADELRRAVEQVQLSAQVLKQTIGELSGGQAQRIALARALMVKPQFLLADEPTSGLDLPLREQMKALLTDICQRQQMGLMVVTHDISMVAGLCDRLLVMNQGVIVEDRDTNAVLHAPQHPYTQALLAAVPCMPCHIQHLNHAHSLSSHSLQGHVY
ncbi:ABC transporter ATP-binding protein [Vibrio zhugei]|uniref:ABC transporter ATP-binding protein n=1 Tax=Vibrio zhugei TaxID=2479546 RepID=A0ABV7CCE7_9VIBR|nr:ABC transporter ATP-binding protein [Vibrio zhugei]